MPRPGALRRLRTRRPALLGLACAAAVSGFTAATAIANTTGSASAASPGSLLFGIYPGGPAGGATGSVPDDVSKDLAAVQQLDSSGAPFVVHLYAEYYGPGSYSAAQEVGSEVQTFANAGIQVELVECYRPTDKNATTDVPGFVSWTQATLKALSPYLTYLQVTNESNVSGDASSNDGSFPGSEDALIAGVEAAHSYVTAAGQPIKIGFNWSYNTTSSSWWSYLAAHGGPAFTNDVDWAGIDVYPGTWTSLPSQATLTDGVSSVMTQAITSMRETYMPLAGLSASVPIQVTETGYPTSPTRTYTDQQSAVDSEVNAVNALRLTDNVSALEMFDLRDAVTSNTAFTDQYGLMTDQWGPKPAFSDYGQLISTLGGARTASAPPPPTSPPTSTSTSPTTTTTPSTTTTPTTPSTSTGTSGHVHTSTKKAKAARAKHRLRNHKRRRRHHARARRSHWHSHRRSHGNRRT